MKSLYFSQANQQKCIILFLAATWLCSVAVHADVAFFGRDYPMYKEMFCLSDEDVKGKSILDVPAGPSTFLATLREKGELASQSKAIDIGYSDSKTLETLLDKGMRMSFSPFYEGTYKTWPPQKRQTFLTMHETFKKIHKDFLDYYRKYPDLYVRGDIRHLNQVVQHINYDLILSANLLFLYSTAEIDLDERFHFEAIMSMAQQLKEKGEIRIFPIDTLMDSSTPSFLPRLIKDLEIADLKVEIKSGCTPSVGQRIKGHYNLRGQMMVIRRTH